MIEEEEKVLLRAKNSPIYVLAGCWRAMYHNCKDLHDYARCCKRDRVPVAASVIMLCTYLPNCLF